MSDDTAGGSPRIGTAGWGLPRQWRDAFPEYRDTTRPQRDPRLSIANKLATQPELFFVAVDGVRVVGTVMAGSDGHRGWMYSLAVDTALRRNGVGTRLVRQVEAVLAERGCPKVNLQVLSAKAEVRSFYERLGAVYVRDSEPTEWGRVLAVMGVSLAG